MNTIKYLTQAEATVMDQLLMGKGYGFSTDQLMELAGLSCAQAIQKVYHSKLSKSDRILTICGPGNNGGDGLVAARHLVHFGFNVDLLYPKRTDKELYKNLLLQCNHVGIELIHEIPSEANLVAKYGLIVDAIFGYSFNGAIRAPFDSIVQVLTSTSVPIASIDIPSGWDVEKGM
eukprot:gene15394-18256_t